MNIYNLNDYFEFHFNLSRFDTGVATDADATPTWRCYEENNDTVVTNDNCAKRDDANTTGYYYARGQITGVAGFEVGKNYVVRAAATVNSVAAAAVIGTFKVISVTRGLAGTALPDAAADAAGGLPISDAGGLDLDTLNTNVSSILTDTGTDGVLLTAAYNAAKTAAQAGDAMTLANDAITAAKFDESTAFPIKAADTGATIIARAGDAMTLTAAYDAAKTAAQAGNAMTLTAAYDAAKTAAQAGNAMTLTAAYDAAKTAAQVGSAMTLADDAITAAKLNTGAITADAFAADAIVAATLATGAITADAFAADSLVAATFATNSITADALAADAVTEIQTGLALETTAQDILTDTGTTLPGTLTTILADTNELQTEFVDGGRLDLLIDAIKAKTDNLPSGVAKGVALANFEFVMIDSTDHITPMISLTVAGTISKDGGAFVGVANAIFEVGSGVYKINITADEMNADVISLIFSAAGADTRIITIVTS